MAWSEERLHRWLARRPRPRILAGSAGHDAAVLRAAKAGERPVCCVDSCVEGVHYEPGTPPLRVGRKAAARALSDLAATAARPRAVLLALSAPAEREETWLRAVIRGVAAAAGDAGAELVAGDLCCAAGPAQASVTALGTLPAGPRPPGRDRARPGQVLVVTGPLGGSSLGRHLRIRPRLAEGAWLHRRGATALMDVSDGLARDLARLAAASGVRLELDRVPVHRDVRRLAGDGHGAHWHALHDGEDHELVATLPARRLPRVLAEAPRRCPGLVVLGRVGSCLLYTSPSPRD